MAGKKFDPEKYLAPWEVDSEGKALAEPAAIDPEKLKKYLINLLSDKEKAQEERDTAKTEATTAAEALTELQRKNESDEQRREREAAERETELATMRAESAARRKLETLEEAFPNATPARLRKLAKRVNGDEKDWVDDAKELVEDGFKIVETPAGEEQQQEVGGRLETRPRVVRSDGTPASETATTDKPKSVSDELTAAGILPKGW